MGVLFLYFREKSKRGKSLINVPSAMKTFSRYLSSLSSFVTSALLSPLKTIFINFFHPCYLLNILLNALFNSKKNLKIVFIFHKRQIKVVELFHRSSFILKIPIFIAEKWINFCEKWIEDTFLCKSIKKLAKGLFFSWDFEKQRSS